MGDFKKVLKKFNNSEKDIIKNIIIWLKDGSFENLDIKKLQGIRDIYRVRKGTLRILFYFELDKIIKILAIKRRSDKIYKIE